LAPPKELILHLIIKEPEYVTTFGLTQDEEEKINVWLHTIEPRPLDFVSRLGLGLPTNPPFPTLEYCFIPTGIGVSITVREVYTGQTLDLTDYESW
jgi:hypothetical protein